MRGNSRIKLKNGRLIDMVTGCILADAFENVGTIRSEDNMQLKQ